MKFVQIAILTILIIMSLAAGLSKAASMPQEVQFFADAGLGSVWLIPLGVLQIVGALAATFPQSRRTGLLVVAVGFLISSGIIIMTGNTTFGLFSLIPVALAIAIRSRLPIA